MADESTSITLTLYQDGQLVREELFDRTVINVGKQASSNLRLDDVNISRKHAVIERRQEGRWRITDLGSTNGTNVNGRQITQANRPGSPHLVTITGADSPQGGTDRLAVHGIDSLRVIDASVMPHITSGNTNAPTVMIAEKGAEFILDDANR